ncbi:MULTISPECIES: TetR/AcrR family transcriptional regulator [unclassified Pseudofrankia]|uniref:TetR/AcrR family transcriptional regulator n=1 Tax=unclassified Pseudofrankia TaxID=2994372 RepID=UPI0008DB2F01|nr:MULTISPECIES: TetR/AcrR family transcriptional regulator [unclassified Pseudofrankia]MDT3443173.1 helix-turn-helix domain-containing protein [Pseudofrankia sp. BMG5.37]OHV58949.1 TetR family transcriptional regulator [Pseudofrankia sp. BMG5.36]
MVVKKEGPSHRQRQAMATKAQIAAAARNLFAAQGYVATTINAIAETADIPAPTIYSAFGTKAKILQAIAWGVAATLDIDTSHDEALAQPDPARGLRLAARIQRRQYELMYDVIAIYQEAARTDPDIAHDLQTITGNRERAFHRHIEAIAAHLAPGVSVSRALDIYVALVLPEIYRTLVLERRWTIDQYESWLADTLIHQLLYRT